LIKKQSSLKMLRVDPLHPAHDLINEAALVIKNGGVIAFPTRHLYGLGADAFNADAVNRVFEIKRRPHDKPLLVLIDKPYDLTRLVQQVPYAATRIMERFWPGAVTIVFKAKHILPINLTGRYGKNRGANAGTSGGFSADNRCSRPYNRHKRQHYR